MMKRERDGRRDELKAGEGGAEQCGPMTAPLGLVLEVSHSCQSYKLQL